MPAAAPPDAPRPATVQAVPSQAMQNLPGQDTTAATQTAPADTTSAFSVLNENFNDGLRLVLTGEWNQLWTWARNGVLNSLDDVLLTIGGAVAFLVVAYVLYRVAYRLLNQFLERNRHIDTGLQRLLMKTYRVGAMLLIAVLVLDRLQFNVTALFAGLGIAGIAIGFAARDSLENFISGLTILMDRPFRVGDNVEVEGQFGTVRNITLRSTRIRTFNNEVLVMPNVQMITQKLMNHTMLSTLRVEIDFGIAYKERPGEARDVLLALTEGDERLHPDYPPSVVVTEMADSSVNMRLRLYLKNPKQEVPVRFDYTEKVREALREADIEIPFPHLQLFVDETKAFEGAPWMPAPQQRAQLGDGSSDEGRQTADG
jgi:small conductance mechanosensitive channel